MTDPIRITPIGGLGEVGRNMTVVEHDGIRLVIDCGIGFPHGEDRGLGVDALYRDALARQTAARLRAAAPASGGPDRPKSGSSTAAGAHRRRAA